MTCTTFGVLKHFELFKNNCMMLRGILIKQNNAYVLNDSAFRRYKLIKKSLSCSNNLLHVLGYKHVSRAIVPQQSCNIGIKKRLRVYKPNYKLPDD